MKNRLLLRIEVKSRISNFAIFQTAVKLYKTESLRLIRTTIFFRSGLLTYLEEVFLR